MTRRPTIGLRVRATVGSIAVLVVTVLVGPLHPAPAAAVGTGSISGTVTAPDGTPLRGVGVFLANTAGEPYSYDAHVFTDTDGRYAFGELEAGGYKLLFQPQREEPSSYNYVAEWWQDRPDRDSATVITLADGAARSDVHAQLTPGASVSGTITDESGTPILDAVIWARRDGGPGYSAKSDRDGKYLVGGLPAGTYTLKFDSPWSGPQAVFVDEWWDDAADGSAADRFSLTTGQAASGFDARLSTGSTITGRVLGFDGQPVGEGQPYGNMYVEAVRIGGEEPYEHGSYTSNGRYSIAGLRAGSYALSFQAHLPTGWVRETWRDSAGYVDATLITVDGQETVELEDARVGSGVERRGGVDRYATAVGVSESAFPWGDVPTVYLASGADFPDALAAAPAAGLDGGPVLLTPRDSLPSEVADEIARLGPERVFIVGGEGSVSAGVALQVDDLIDGPVERRAGASRYETAVEISRARFADAGAVVYLASGAAFPDALSAAPLAGKEPGPVLLTTRDRMPGAVEDEIRRLQPSKIVVLGGDGSVAPSVLTRLAQLSDAPIERLAGADRYATALAVSQAGFESGADVVYVANGQNFPDALAAAPVALKEGGPVLLTSGVALTQDLVDEITRLRPRRITVLGGYGAVSGEVQVTLARMTARF
ncbi:cell wall-binding repeat-containing protein [Agromyces sp. ZXT2-6]|uniref:cell wall-binding repeat-containing protein n=1 Tax=Agromyces sp. ZXT2-6 TaxID=3461153 RepID=UPI004054BE24